MNMNMNTLEVICLKVEVCLVWAYFVVWRHIYQLLPLPGGVVIPHVCWLVGGSLVRFFVRS